MIFQDLPIDPRTAASEMTVDKLLSYTPSADQVFFYFCVIYDVYDCPPGEGGVQHNSRLRFPGYPGTTTATAKVLKRHLEPHHNPHPGTARPT